jgi:hypothetical protein
MSLLKKAKRATCQNDRPPSVDEWIFYPEDGMAILDLILLDYTDDGRYGDGKGAYPIS